MIIISTSASKGTESTADVASVVFKMIYSIFFVIAVLHTVNPSVVFYNYFSEVILNISFTKMHRHFVSTVTKPILS